MYQEIAFSIAESIEKGGFKSGDRIPSTRQLAARLGVARNTVLQAFALLESQNYIKTQTGLGTIVLGQTHSSDRALNVAFSPQDLYSNYAHAIQNVGDFSPHRQQSDDESTLADLSRVRSLFCTSLRPSELAHLLRGEAHDELGLEVLRKATSRFLSRVAGVYSDYLQVAIFPSRRSALEVIVRLLVCKNDNVMLMNENSADLGHLLRIHGANQTQVNGDDNGIVVDALNASSSTPKLVFVNKAQYGKKALADQNRLSLLNWATARQCMIVEDGTATEKLMTRQSITALHSLDDSGSVIYLYNLEELFSPLTRTAVLVLPNSIVPQVRKIMSLSGLSCSLTEQYAMSKVLGSGLCEHILRKRQDRLRQFRNSLVQRLGAAFGSHIKVHFTINGLRFVCAPNHEGQLIEWCDQQGLSDSLDRSQSDELVFFDLTMKWTDATSAS